MSEWYEFALAGICIALIAGCSWWMVTRAGFGEAMSAWATRHSKETEAAIIKAYADGHEAGQEYERLRGSLPSK